MKPGWESGGLGFLALLFMLQYGVMTGGSVSTMRAVCMFLISTGAKITGRIYDLPTALAVSAMMILGESGAYLYNSGFLLSFSAVARSWNCGSCVYQDSGKRKGGQNREVMYGAGCICRHTADYACLFPCTSLEKFLLLEFFLI